jgi:CRISPR system Cascade subunit CasA
VPTGAHANVLVGDWIPVSWRVDAPEEIRRPALGLRELLEQARWISSVDITAPPALSAVYRVLYALAARVGRLDRETVPNDDSDWEERRFDLLAEGMFSQVALEDYFGSYETRFDLFHPDYPFMQDPRLSEQCEKAAGVNKLVIGRSAGNNHSWFGHHLDTGPLPVPPDQALLDLLTWSYYGPSGKCSARTVAGHTGSNTKAGPLRTALSYHPVGASLFETLVVGVPGPQGELSDPDDPCPWERDDLPDPLGRAAVRGTCSWLTGRSQHALLLVPDRYRVAVTDAYITWGFVNAVDSPLPDPYVISQLSKAGNWYARRADSGRALWRDLDALAFKRSSGSDQINPPPVFMRQPDPDAMPERLTLRVQALGFDQDGQAKDTQFVAGLTPPSFDTARLLQAEPNRHRIGDLRVAAELCGWRLEKAVKKAWADFSDQKVADCAWSQQAVARYWPAAEEEFWQHLASGEFDGLRSVFRRLAEPIFDEVTRGATASLRGARAVESARFELYGGRPKRKSAAETGNTLPDVETGDQRVDEKTGPHREFIAKVILQCRDDYHPEVRAALRSALGKPWDRIPRQAFKFVNEAGLPSDVDDEQRLHAYYAVAAMIAAVPKRTALRQEPGRRDFGYCLADSVGHGTLSHKAAERYLDLLVKQSATGLHRHLPGVVGRLAERPGTVDWVALLADLESWPRRREQLSRRWLRSFYRTRHFADLAVARGDDENPEPPGAAA